MVTTRYAASMVFHTDGSLIDGCEGFSFHRTGEGGSGFKISSTAGIFNTNHGEYLTLRKMLDFD
jgi:hypothetical protein